MSLDMSGHIDDVFESVPVSLIYTPGGYVDGIWQDGIPVTEPYTANVQQLGEKELSNLLLGGERILDSRKVYINDGDFSLLNLGNNMELLGETWKITERDVREWRSYAKLILVRYDDQ